MTKRYKSGKGKSNVKRKNRGNTTNGCEDRYKSIYKKIGERTPFSVYPKKGKEKDERKRIEK